MPFSRSTDVIIRCLLIRILLWHPHWVERWVGRREEQQVGLYYGLLYITDHIWCDKFHCEVSARAGGIVPKFCTLLAEKWSEPHSTQSTKWQDLNKQEVQSCNSTLEELCSVDGYACAQTRMYELVPFEATQYLHTYVHIQMFVNTQSHTDF